MRAKRAALTTLNEAISYTERNPNKHHLIERNDQIYEILRKNRMCVIPDPTFRSVDGLPHFEFIESVRAAHLDEAAREK